MAISQLEKLALDGYQYLTAIFRIVAILYPSEESERLVTTHSRHRDAIILRLRQEPGLAKAAIDFTQKSMGLFSVAATPAPLSLRTNMMAMLSHVYREYSIALGEPHRKLIRSDVRALLTRAISNYLDDVAGQIAGLSILCKLALELARDHKRVVLLEFPIGNSVPIRLLKDVLINAGHGVEVIMVALSRKNSQAKTILKEAFLFNELSTTSLRSGDLVFYPDEWNTGTNFEKLSQIISKVISQRADGSSIRFVPIGLLAAGARKQEKALKYLNAHDDLLAKVGLTGETCRIDFVELQFGAREAGPFFWSEHDRMAGYRKLQLFGSLYSSLDAAIEKLASDAEALKRACYYNLETQALAPGIGIHRILRATWSRWLMRVYKSTNSLPQRTREAVQTQIRRWMPRETKLAAELTKAFRRGLVEYRARRDDIRAIVHPSNTTQVEDMKTAIVEIEDLIANILGRRSDGILCVKIAGSFEYFEGGVDPKDRYLFKDHVPAIRELSGDDRVLCEALFSLLQPIV